MDKRCNGQQTRSLTSQFRDSTYRALTLLRRKAKQQQIAGKLCSQTVVFTGRVKHKRVSPFITFQQGTKVFTNMLYTVIISI